MAYPAGFFPVGFFDADYWPGIGVDGTALGAFAPGEQFLVNGSILADLVASVSGIGRTYLGIRHLRNSAKAHSFLADPQGDGLPTRLRGAFVERVAIDEEWFSSTRTMAHERWVITCLESYVSDVGEVPFGRLLDRVAAKMRANPVLSDAVLLSAIETPTIDHVKYGDTLMARGVIGLEVEELITITQPTVTPSNPTNYGTDATAGEDMSDVQGVISNYLRAADETALVINDFELIMNEVAFANRMVVPDASPDLPNKINTWQMRRIAVDEDRGVGNLVDGSEEWRLDFWRGWSDERATYCRHQSALDQVRTQFRALGNAGGAHIGRTLNSPLQVDEIVDGDIDGKLVHHAECRLMIDEVIHA